MRTYAVPGTHLGCAPMVGWVRTSATHLLFFRCAPCLARKPQERRGAPLLYSETCGHFIALKGLTSRKDTR